MRQATEPDAGFKTGGNYCPQKYENGEKLPGAEIDEGFGVISVLFAAIILLCFQEKHIKKEAGVNQPLLQRVTFFLPDKR